MRSMRSDLIAGAAMLLYLAAPAKAAYEVVLAQEGSRRRRFGSGTLDIRALASAGPSSFLPFVFASSGR